MGTAPVFVPMLMLWTLFLLMFWILGLPLGLEGRYIYP